MVKDAPLGSGRGDKGGPIFLAEQGTFHIGGSLEFRDPNASRTLDARLGPGSIAVNHMYVEYQIPAQLKCPYPIVFMHGGSHTGAFWRTTPDGRQGWFTSFTRRGFGVYSVDGPNRGRAGWDPTRRFAVSQGRLPHTELEPANIYSKESAWTTFRWGPTFGTPYPGTQFPLEYVDDYVKQIQAAYRDDAASPSAQAGLAALIERIGSCVLIGWSTGTGNAMVAATSTPTTVSHVKAIVALEGYPAREGNAPSDQLAAKIPFLGLVGDNEDHAPYERYAAGLTVLGGDATSIFLPDAGLRGNGHTMAIEKNNEDIADLVEDWIQSRCTGPS